MIRCLKPGPHQQQCRNNVRLSRSNIRLCSIRQCCCNIVAGVDGDLVYGTMHNSFGPSTHSPTLVVPSGSQSLSRLIPYTPVRTLCSLLVGHQPVRSDARSRGHPYKLFIPGCSSTTGHNYFTHRVARVWNNLLENSTNFSSLALFKRSLSSNILARYCKIYYF